MKAGGLDKVCRGLRWGSVVLRQAQDKLILFCGFKERFSSMFPSTPEVWHWRKLKPVTYDKVLNFSALGIAAPEWSGLFYGVKMKNETPTDFP